MLFKLFQIAILAFGVWLIVAEIKDIVNPGKLNSFYRAGEREFF